MELSSNGYGSPQVLMSERVDLICAAYDYHKFKVKYERQAYLMREKNAGR